MDTRDSSTKRAHSQIIPEFKYTIFIVNKYYFRGFLQNDPLYIIASWRCQILAIPLLLSQHHLMVQIPSHIPVPSMLNLSIVIKRVDITPTGRGDLLKDGRYKILHKLGWGGYSTVWAARDQRFDIYILRIAFYLNIGSLIITSQG